MSDSQETPWSDNPNAPKISYHLYFGEKSSFAGTLIGVILYGMVIVLFFKCMTTLFDPVHRRGAGIKWGLVSYTSIMFSFVTVLTATDLDILSVSYIDDREFPGVEGLIPPGPLGYQWLIDPGPLSIAPNVMFVLCNWLADGLLLYRCYIIYSKNTCVAAFPCLMYLVSVGLGIVVVYQSAQLISSDSAVLPYFSISLSLNTLLTLMIVTRLILHTRSIRTAMGTRSGGLYKAIVTVLVESCALFAVNSILFIGLWGAHNYAERIFRSTLSQTQVIATLLVIQRVADKSALNSDSVVSKNFSEFKARSGGQLTVSSGILPGGDPMSSPSMNEKNSGELAVGVTTTIDFDRREVWRSSGLTLSTTTISPRIP